jgi:hypothetical protein
MSEYKHPIYQYKITVTGAGEQAWSTEGTLFVASGDFATAVGNILRHTFLQLTEGKAVFGQPGVGCQGPYEITELTFKRKKP